MRQEFEGDRAGGKFVKSIVTKRLLHVSPIRGEPGKVRGRFVAEGNHSGMHGGMLFHRAFAW